MNNYEDLYREDIEKAKVYRQGYLDSVKNLALFSANELEIGRCDYITPEKLEENREKYVADLKEIIGRPLFDRRQKCEVSKIFVGLDGQGYIYRLVFTFEKGIKFCVLLF